MSYPPISETALNTKIKANAYEPYYNYKSPIDLYDIHKHSQQSSNIFVNLYSLSTSI